MFRSTIFAVFCSIMVVKAVLDEKDEQFLDQEADRYDWSRHPCHRICGENEAPKICYYVFVVEKYSSMSKACYDCPENLDDCYRPHCIPVDGVQKTLYTVNRQLPGPTIEVCRDDRIVVDVRNGMLSDSTTVHWHGLKQVGTPYMDGVPFVSQCPILPGQFFRYEFNASSDGTYFWHSHIGSQRADGFFGALIIHPSFSDNIHKKLYDYDDQIMVVNDWSHLYGDGGEVKQFYDRVGVIPDTILVNGYGRLGTSQKDKTLTTPLAVFQVTENKRHRFRMINAGSKDCPFELFVDNHTMIVISLDSSNIEPIEVDAVTIWAGERVDFIIKANQKPGNYWMRLRGYGICKQTNTSAGIFQGAILHYDSERLEEPESHISWNFPGQTNKTRILNPFQSGTESSHLTNLNVPLLNALAPNDPALTDPVDHQIYISFDYYPKDNYDFHRNGLYGFYEVPEYRRSGTFQLNHITNKLPSFPILTQPELIKSDTFCNSTSISSDCTKKMCTCSHAIQVRLNSVVELVLVDEGKYAIVNHPLHLHGHFFRVISSVKLKGNVTIERIKKLDSEGKILRRLDRAPIKDTIKAPGGGYTIIRFYANNPGYWFFHCHIEQHNNVGMSLIYKVGEHSEFPPQPQNFPTCENFVPATKKSVPKSSWIRRLLHSLIKLL